jgi:hypothetical protein
MSKQKVFLYTSEIAAYIGQNKYDFVTPFERLWKRCDSNYDMIINEQKNIISTKISDVNKINDKIQKLKDDLENKKITKREYNKRIKEFEESYNMLTESINDMQKNIDNIDLTQEERLKKVLGETHLNTIKSTSIGTDEKRLGIENKLKDLNLSDTDKKSLQNEATNYINKTHGTLYEDSAIKKYEAKFKVSLDTTQKFYKTRLLVSDTSKIDWYIGGKMDGVYIDPNDSSKNYIIEVKNRTKGFFTTLRDYEKTQIHLYMYMTGINVTKLVEKYNDKIRITVIYNDQEYTDSILESLSIFINRFETGFLENNDLKTYFVCSNSDKKKCILKDLYLNKIYKVQNDKIERELSNCESSNCLIDDLD